MRFDKELVREVLLWLEADERDPQEYKDIQLLGWSQEQIAYTVMILAEGGLIVAEDLSNHDGWDWKARRLTYDGYEYLGTVRDSEVWKTTKSVAEKAGAYSLKLLKEAGKAVINQKLKAIGLQLP